jgi:Transposase
VAALRDQAFIGLDIGKTHHWVCALDGAGKLLLSRKIANDETEIVTLLTTAGTAGATAGLGGRHHRRAVGADP